ncbi:MAG: hypothetical protein GY906_24475 [bacterium]|nr:hypothetical protein [bacterium]
MNEEGDPVWDHVFQFIVFTPPPKNGAIEDPMLRTEFTDKLMQAITNFVVDAGMRSPKLRSVKWQWYTGGVSPTMWRL